MSAIDAILTGLKDVFAAAALREHITIQDEKIAALTAEIATQRQEIAELKAENGQCKKRIQDAGEENNRLRKTQTEFVEARGALFKRIQGGFDVTVYCPECRAPLSDFNGDFPFVCDRCGINLTFKAKDVPDILKSLA